ncbi:hypothetical protein [Sphingobacterium wenxiniae]|uniref:Uncharacterized protein n=1 Tax=Sphingobacterium wenxiniae TaxID=683125 RepID=A0A1I6SRE3_9SPHI|nr:hypothetical protein [Sphingobacterium wenxiniae]SFS79480.1 hypothetical protein SAMN05660206_10544 [Sphingobacterium wenxiniae]
MNIEQLKTEWQQFPSPHKSKKQLWSMTRIINHPDLYRIRVQFVMEVIAISLFCFIYYDAFDGQNKPLWANVLLLCSITIYLVQRIMAWFYLRSTYHNQNLKANLNHFVKRLRWISLLSLSTYILFMTAVVTFFLSSIIFTPTKLTGLILIIIATAWGGFSSLKLWRKRITGIQAVLRGYEEEFHT